MNDVIEISKIDHASILINAERSIEAELIDAFSFYVPNYKFMPKYKYGVWDGKIRLYDAGRKKLPAGLFKDLAKFAKSRDYQIQINENSLPFFYGDDKFDINIKISDGKNNEITPRDYQIDSVNYVVKHRRGIIISPTGSGKSLMIYLIFRYFSDKKFLIVVPTTTLVEQMYKDFIDYAQLDDTIDVESEVHRIYSGHEKTTDKRCIISTWQSIHNLDRNWFKSFEAVIGDEAHTFKAKSLQKIMDNSVNAEIRVGTTGTLDGSLTNELMLKGEFGPVYTATTTKDLMDREDLAQMEIKAIQLEHEKLPKMTYQQEIQHLVADTKRTKFISKLGIKQKENTLILFNYISHGKEIYNKIIELNEKKDRPIYFIAGEIDTKEREDIRSSMESHNDAILVASLGTFAQGVNIKNLHNIIFASPTKSQVRVLQAIGRGLRKFKDFKLTVYDVIDNYAGQRKDKNYAYKHGIERMKIYMKQQFKVTQHKLKI